MISFTIANLKSLIEFLKGKKTFLVCAATVVYAMYAFEKHLIDWGQFTQLLSLAGIGGGLRSAMDN